MMVNFTVGMIELYQRVVSPLLKTQCRFYPSCSQYAIDALRKYGLGKGLLMSLQRFVKCQPFHPGGYDPA